MRARRTFDWMLIAASAAAAGALAAGALGALHPAGDSLAVFRPHLAVTGLCLALACALLRLRRAAAMVGAASLLALLSLLPHAGGARATPDTQIALYQKNLSFRMADPAPVVADILETGADIVTLQEVAGRTRIVRETLKNDFPTQLICPFTGVGGPAVLSRFPAVPGSGACLDGAAAVTLESPCGPVRILAVHLHWPWPYGQGPQLARLLPDLGSDTPTLVGGDFNMVQWSHALRAIGRATGTRPVNRPAVTLPGLAFGLGLPIDHVLAPARAGRVEVRPLLGSDHRGLFARLPCP